MAKELVYVTYTCKRCGSAFLDVDISNNINEIPLKQDIAQIVWLRVIKMKKCLKLYQKTKKESSLLSKK